MEIFLLSKFGDVMSSMLYVGIALLVLLVMITVHEFGHYVAGKIFGFGIEEFAIGFGPQIFKKKLKNGELFSIRCLPLGGYCAFKGEDKEDEDPLAFNNKKPWQRIIVLVSGALMNYLLALLIIVTMFGVYGKTCIMTYNVNENYFVSEQTSFKDRDVILSANGKNVFMLTDLMTAVEEKEKGDIVTFEILRGGERKTIEFSLLSHTNFKSLEDAETLFKAMGIDYNDSDSGLRSTGVKLGVFETIGSSFIYSFKIAGTIFTTIRQLFTGAIGLSSIGGTVTTISVTANVVRAGGLWSLLSITSFIGVNLALFNLLPIPALDGSRALFTTIEWVRKKPLNRRIEGLIHGVGFVLLLLFAILVDLQRCF